jgi:hypothetical protein
VSSPDLSRISSLATVVAGVAFIIAELLTPFVAPNLSEAYRNVGTVAFTDAFFIQSLLTLFAGAMLLGGLVGLYARQSHATGSLGAVGFLLAFFGTVLVTGDFYTNTFVTPMLAIGNYEFLGGPSAGVLRLWLPTEFGFLAATWLLFAWATVRAGVYPRGPSWLLLVGAVVALPPFPYVNIAFDAAIAWLGMTLMKQGTTSSWSRRHLRRARA